MDRLRILAETRGSFSRAEALSEGHDDQSIARSIRLRLWVRVRPGAYTFTDLWPDDEEQRHRVRGDAVAAKLGDTVALSHTTAALEHGLRVWDADLSKVHVTRIDGGAGRTESGVVHHEGLVLPSDLRRTANGFHVTHAPRAAVETASLLRAEPALVVLDSCLHLKLATREELDSVWGLLRQWPGMLSSQVAMRMAHAGGQSVGESRSRFLFYAFHLPAPLLQYEVRDASGRLLGITDFAWPEHRLLGEFDGKVKYVRYLRPEETPGEAVFREKRREEAICESTGWRMVRLIWADLYRPAETAARVHRLLRHPAAA